VQVFTTKLQHIVSSKAKYGKALGLTKKLLDIAQKLDCFYEVYGMFQAFIDEKQAEILKEIQVDNTELNDQEVTEINCTNPLPTRRRGHPPKWYHSEGENQKSAKELKENEIINVNNNSNQKKIRKCKRCQGTGHDMRN
jgi:hypothetical protein